MAYSGPPTIRPEASNPLGNSEDSRKIARLETIIRYLLAKSLSGEAIAPTDKILRDFLGIVDLEPTREDVLRQLGAMEVLGKMTCPKCGSTVKDLAGVRDERCPTCGEVVPSER